VNTTWQVFQGVTFGCVQCHDHPYEALRHEEYYNFLAVFNTSVDWDLRSDEPKLPVPLDREQFDEARRLDTQIQALREQKVAETRAMLARDDA